MADEFTNAGSWGGPPWRRLPLPYVPPNSGGEIPEDYLNVDYLNVAANFAAQARLAHYNFEQARFLADTATDRQFVAQMLGSWDPPPPTPLFLVPCNSHSGIARQMLAGSLLAFSINPCMFCSAMANVPVIRNGPRHWKCGCAIENPIADIDYIIGRVTTRGARFRGGYRSVSYSDPQMGPGGSMIHAAEVEAEQRYLYGHGRGADHDLGG